MYFTTIKFSIRKLLKNTILDVFQLFIEKSGFLFACKRAICLLYNFIVPLYILSYL